MELSDISNKNIYNNNLKRAKEMEQHSENINIDGIQKPKPKLNKALPENFFEKVIEFEMKLKYDFSMETLNNLVDLFSVKNKFKKINKKKAAIEFYESKDDVKYRDYQNRLNILLSQPDILKNINKHNNNKSIYLYNLFLNK